MDTVESATVADFDDPDKFGDSHRPVITDRSHRSQTLLADLSTMKEDEVENDQRPWMIFSMRSEATSCRPYRGEVRH